MSNSILVRILQFTSERVYAQPAIDLPDDPPEFIDMIKGIVFIVSKIGPAIGLFGFGMIIYGGYLWIVSGGEPQKKQKAQATLTWSIIGVGFFYLIRMFLSWVLDWFVQ
ncbi:hypothetical protein GX618_01475 [Candidatus Dojkabacteria bacterium]|uniref:Uncharacterized protein n=1 Tax=Candidatus Dojkabacteria bacterium TaxID=2099670 RepID=A0A847ESZ1_9BACT|nr:hypothetical protein [Candidatus Dojkabacteria bacterium]